MRSKIFQGLLLVVVIPFIAWSIFEKCEISLAQLDEVMAMEPPLHPAVQAAVIVALDDKKVTQAEYAVIKQFAYKYGPGATKALYLD